MILPFYHFLTKIPEIGHFSGHHCFTEFSTVLDMPGFLMAFRDFRDFMHKITKITNFTRISQNVTEEPDTSESGKIQ